MHSSIKKVTISKFYLLSIVLSKFLGLSIALLLLISLSNPFISSNSSVALIGTLVNVFDYNGNPFICS